MKREEIEKKVIEIVVDQFAILGGEIDVNLDSNFVDDLGADRLDDIEMAMSCEEAFDLEISDEDAEKCETVKDIVNLIERLKS